MKTSSFKNANYIGWILIVLVFVFIYFSYFFILIPKKEAQIQQKGFRILKEYGSNMLNKYSYFENHFEHYGSFYSIRFLENNKEIYKKIEIDPKLKKEIENFIDGLQPYVFTDNRTHESNFEYNELDKSLIFSFRSTETSDVNNDLEKIIQNYTSKTSLNTFIKRNYTHYVPVENFMENLKFDRLFENIVLFDEEFVFYNSKEGNLAEITNPGALSDSTQIRQGGVFKTLKIMGNEKHAMILPIDLPGKRFYIAGLITDTDYKNKTRSINKQFLILIAGIILLVFAGMPILKIIFIDKNERLIIRDASASGISFLFGIGLFIILVTAVAKRHFIDYSNQKQRIKNISATLNSNVSENINSIKSLGEIIVKNQETKNNSISDTILTELNTNSGLYRDTNLRYPFPLNEIILLDKNGIVRKGYTRTPFPGLVEVNLSQRQYFQNIKNLDQSWHGANDINFYVESIKSFNTGNVETAISFYTNSFDTLNVLAITSVIPSLYHQVLPEDVEFVIIDKSGKVLYHSIAEKNLHENFVLECESDYKLVNAINRNSTENFQLYYNEKKWLAHIVPINETPLYHITLLNLNQADNTNARIFLFSFYFLIATLAFIIFGLLVVRWLTLTKTTSEKNSWFLNWMVLQPSKQQRYNILSYILLFLIVLQFWGLFIISHPIVLLFYQFPFIVYSLFVSMLFLKREKPHSNNTFFKEYLIELNVLAVVLIFSVLFIFIETEWYRFLPAITLFVITPLIYYLILKIYKNSDSKVLKTQNSLLSSKRSYLIFLFIWLSSVTGVPTVVNYFSIKNHEINFRNQEIKQRIAQDNVELESDYININEEWVKPVLGNGLENLSVSHLPDINYFPEKTRNTIDESLENQIYTSLPDPITIWYNQPKLISQKSHITKVFSGDTLFYKKATRKGAIKVSDYKPATVYPRIKHTLLILFVFIVIATCVWFLLKFMAKVLLNLNQEKPNIPDITWLELFQKNEQKRVLLNTFNGTCFLNKTKEWLNTSRNKTIKIEEIKAIKFLDPAFKINSLPSRANDVIWISGISQIIYDFKKHEKLLSVITELNQNSKTRIIIELPFNFDLIDDFYKEFIASNESESEKHAEIYSMQLKWKNLFDNYFIYDGFINQDKSENREDIREEDSFWEECGTTEIKVQFQNIWSNLSSNEKILLYDLADDGLLNRKNKTMIQRLVDKRLIIENPYPALFSNKFEDFVRNNLKPDEVRSIEQKLGVKGSWHNTKYIILLIVVPLAALIFISQGISLEKAFTILGGGLAVLTGIIRLFDSGLFRSSS